MLDVMDSSAPLCWLTVGLSKAENRRVRGYRWAPVDKDAAALSLASSLPARRSVRVKRVSFSTKRPRETSVGASASRKRKSADADGNTNTNGHTNGDGGYDDDEDVVAQRAAIEEQKRALEARLALLRSAQQNISSNRPRNVSVVIPPSPYQYQQHYQTAAASPATKKRKAATPKPTSYTPLPIVSTPATAAADYQFPMFAAPSSVSSSPPSTPHTAATTTKAGRSVKAPQQFAPRDAAPLSPTMKRCLTLTNHLMNHKSAKHMQIFNAPVNYADPAAPYFAPSYLETIGGSPMDLSTIKANIVAGAYRSLSEFAADLRLVWRNAQNI